MTVRLCRFCSAKHPRHEFDCPERTLEDRVDQIRGTFNFSDEDRQQLIDDLRSLIDDAVAKAIKDNNHKWYAKVPPCDHGGTGNMRDESTPIGKEIWAAVDKAAKRAPQMRTPPAFIQIMLHIYYLPEPIASGNVNLTHLAIENAVHTLHERGLIVQDDKGPSGYAATARGRAWAEMICHTPLPEKS